MRSVGPCGGGALPQSSSHYHQTDPNVAREPRAVNKYLSDNCRRYLNPTWHPTSFYAQVSPCGASLLTALSLSPPLSRWYFSFSLRLFFWRHDYKYNRHFGSAVLRNGNCVLASRGLRRHHWIFVVLNELNRSTLTTEIRGDILHHPAVISFLPLDLFSYFSPLSRLVSSFVFVMVLILCEKLDRWYLVFDYFTVNFMLSIFSCILE